MSKRKGRGSTGKIFGINQCSLCDAFALTVGTQAHGGVRYCRDCVKHTLGWVQLDDMQRVGLMNRFDEAEKQPGVSVVLKAAAAIPDEHRKAHAIGESKKRLLQAQLEEARGY